LLEEEGSDEGETRGEGKEGRGSRGVGGGGQRLNRYYYYYYYYYYYHPFYF